MLYAAQRVHAPLILKVLFTGWVLAPFAILGAVGATRASLAAFVTVASMLVYGGAAFAPHRPPTPVFVLGPPVTVVIMAIALLVSRRAAR